ncbi:hypothetical protein SCH4B_0275 [Ruegeria sp. TrichCH4B]|nr:hypothetical protein SCH4B_0275 [Ruegeria sp. TrichCH4B]
MLVVVEPAIHIKAFVEVLNIGTSTYRLESGDGLHMHHSYHAVFTR